MPRLSISLDVLLSEFNALKASLAPHACDLKKLSADHYTHSNALKWLKQNEQVDDCAERSHCEQRSHTTKSNWSSYIKLATLKKESSAR